MIKNAIKILFLLKILIIQQSLIGHSSACPLILALLDECKLSLQQVILVAGFYHPIDDGGYSDLLLKEQYNWEKIKHSVKEIVLINSDNDPWGCHDKQAYTAAQQLDAKLIVPFGEGHMGSDTMKQPYREFKLLERLVR